MIIRFDIEGYATGFGHPDWVRTHGAASRTSPVVSTLVEGGAACIGKTVVDEMAFRYTSFFPNIECKLKGHLSCIS